MSNVSAVVTNLNPVRVVQVTVGQGVQYETARATSAENALAAEISAQIAAEAARAEATNGTTLQVTLAATVSGYSAITAAGLPASADTMAHANAFLGVTTQGGNNGTSVAVVSYGPITDTGWSWAPGMPVFLGYNGSLTQNPPTSGVLLNLGVAQTATTFFLRPSAPIQL